MIHTKDPMAISSFAVLPLSSFESNREAAVRREPAGLLYRLISLELRDSLHDKLVVFLFFLLVYRVVRLHFKFCRTMLKNAYDTDITSWSPAGRLFQLEYANEAVNNGSAAVGLKGRDVAVLAALKRRPVAQLSSCQEKVFLVDDHVGMAISGLVADARILARFLRTECMNYRYMYDSDLPLGQISEMLSSKHQRNIQHGGRRPFGVGLLVAGYDSRGPHLYQTFPSGEVIDYKASAMGVRSQSSRTYLEKHFMSFVDCSQDELIIHALQALGSATSEGAELNSKNVSIAVVGKDIPFTILDEETSRKYMDNLVIAAENRGVVDDANEEEAPVQPVDVEE